MHTSPLLNRKTEILFKNTLSSDLVHNNPAMDVSSLFKDIAASVLYVYSDEYLEMAPFL
jgi:hypothetical protein